MYIRKGKAPKYFGLKFPEKPSVLSFNKLEERCVATRIPFMFLYDATEGGQCKLRGSVANVPMDIQPVIKQLPHVPNDTITMPLKFKRKRHYKTNEQKKVIDAAEYFVKQPLYIQDGIKLDKNYDEQNFVHIDSDEESHSNNSIDSESESDFSEVECELRWTDMLKNCGEPFSNSYMINILS